MTWAALLPIIAQYSIPLAEKLWKLYEANSEPTQADWDTLKILGTETAKSRMVIALTTAGISLESDEGKLLLSLVS